jgi:hypothetical protein
MSCERACAATRRSSGSEWPSIRRAKCIPVLQLGPRTHQMAQLLIHRLREQVAAFLPAPLHQRWPHCVFLCAHGSIWVLAQAGVQEAESASMARGSWSEGWPSPKERPAAQAGASHARDPAGDTASVHASLTDAGLFWPSQHGVYRAGESDNPPGRGGTGTALLGYRLADSPLGPAHLHWWQAS